MSYNIFNGSSWILDGEWNSRLNQAKDYTNSELFSEVFNYDRYHSLKKDENGNLICTVEVPGYNKETISAKFADGELVITETETGKCLKKIFIRNDYKATTAKVKDGVLKITFKLIKYDTTYINIE